jgi:hypothetical protein
MPSRMQGAYVCLWEWVSVDAEVRLFVFSLSRRLQQTPVAGVMWTSMCLSFSTSLTWCWILFLLFLTQLDMMNTHVQSLCVCVCVCIFLCA